MAALDFEQLFRFASGDLRRYLSRRISCPHTVSDLIQEAFVKLMGASPLTEIRDARAYLFRTAANLAVNHGTRQRETTVSSSTHEPDSETVLEGVDVRTPDRVVDGIRGLHRVMAAIDDLPPRCKEVFILYRFHNVSQEAIAAQLGISLSMVEKHVIRAMRYCHEALDENA
ncbi:MAG: sigma-70 family RNA polymerase sigma factor [Nitrospira sp.]